MTRRLNALRVGNFKAFSETQRIPLKPITLVFGPNSAGKSSFIHSLALAHEAQFGSDKRGHSRLDVSHTDIGGSAIDLGGFRQYVHRGQLNRRVELGAELKVSALDPKKHRQLLGLLGNVESVTVSIALGMELDDQDRSIQGAEPGVDSIEFLCDGVELIRMSRRRSSVSKRLDGNAMRVDRLNTGHNIFRAIVKAIVEAQTTSELRQEDLSATEQAIAELLPELLVRVEKLFPSAVDVVPSESPLKGLGKAIGFGLLGGAAAGPLGFAAGLAASSLVPVSKGGRSEQLAQTVRLFFPRTFSDLILGVTDVLADEFHQLRYLGPLRSFPPRHIAFAEHEDSNWYSGGGYAWDVVRRDDNVRASVNRWLGSEKLKTPYKLIVRSLLALDELEAPLMEALEILEKDNLDIDSEPDSEHTIGGAWPVIKDVEMAAGSLVSRLESSDVDRILELVLMDQRTNTVVTHRDVGIGISQVLPVLVLAYGSDGKILAMEQPEIHLHPALQAELGDVFIEAALGERKNTFILETHSEHLILRILRRIRETTSDELGGRTTAVRPEDIAVLYVRPGNNGSEFIEIPVRPDGEFITNWPDGFFPERAEELF